MANKGPPCCCVREVMQNINLIIHSLKTIRTEIKREANLLISIVRPTEKSLNLHGTIPLGALASCTVPYVYIGKSVVRGSKITHLSPISVSKGSIMASIINN